MEELELNEDGTVVLKADVTLVSVSIPYGVTEIGYGAFRNCQFLCSVEIPNSVTTIEDEAFRGCSLLESVEIPNSVLTIGENAFNGCSFLRTIELPNSVESIGEYAFNGCTSLQSVVLSDSLTCLEVCLFDGCKSLLSVEVPANVIEIKSCAFYGCKNLRTVGLSTKVMTIADDAFSCCPIEQYDVAEDNVAFKSVDGALFTSDGKVMLCYPVGRKDWEYVVPEGVEKINDCAFDDCSLHAIWLPGSLNEIEANVFDCCQHMREIHIKVENPNAIKINDIEYQGDMEWMAECALYVPIGTGYAYRHHEYFGNFWNVEIEKFPQNVTMK